MAGPPVRQMLMAVAVESDGRGELRIGRSQRLFEAGALVAVARANVFTYNPHPDGQRFLVNALVETGQPTVNVITNWQRLVVEKGATKSLGASHR